MNTKWVPVFGGVVITATVVMLTLAFTRTPALAQTTATPTAQATSATPAATRGPIDLANDKRAYVTLDLTAGFPLDPFFVSVNGGGDVDASTLSSDCKGYISNDPVVRVNWTGSAELVRAFTFSDADPTLIVQTPDGTYMCGDDASALILDAKVTLNNPATGRYNLWVGSAAPNQLLPTVLVLTTRENVNAGTFDLGSLVKRPVIPESSGALPRHLLASVIAEAVSRYKGVVGTASAASAVTASIKSEGNMPAFDIDLPNTTCTGFIGDQPDYVFDWSGEADNLTIFFEGARDTSLLVVTPGGNVLCTDDASFGENVNPQINLSDPEAGRYAVFVGRLTPDYTAEGELTVTNAQNSQPEVLPPSE